MAESLRKKKFIVLILINKKELYLYLNDSAAPRACLGSQNDSVNKELYLLKTKKMC